MKPQFSVKRVWRVQLDHDEDFGRSLIIGLQKWCLDNDIIGYLGSSGPTGLIHYFDADSADLGHVRVWFEKNGVKEVVND